MPLTAGQTLSFYEVLGPLGAGGMGEVYRARDTRLEREVAIKVLPDELADDEDRLRRFEREAKTLASLTHANVAHVYGIDQVDDTCFIVMELVGGEDLAARLARGPLPVPEAIDVCRQIAEGLEAAHEAGVVHRDLKPANVRLTPDGVAKILDFGLAKPIRPKATSEGTSSAESDSFLLTEEGLVLGTPTYMSPEQARAKPVDRRTDVWAFGCVLYECLTGKRAFGGASLTDILAAIVGDQPDWSELPPIPPRLGELLRRCLDKDPRTRLRDAGEARVQLQLARDEPAGSSPSNAVASGRGGWKLALTGIVALAAGVALGMLLRPDSAAVDDAPARSEPRVRVVLETLHESRFYNELALSPDGTRVAWLQDGNIRIRALDELSSRAALREAADFSDWKRIPRSIAWSPDGRELAYFTGEGLFRLPADGGPSVQVIVQDEFASQASGLAWTEDQGIVYRHDDSTRILAVPAIGGDPVTLLTDEEADVQHFDGLAPLPGGGLLVVRHRTDAEDPDTVSIWRGGELRDVLQLPGWEVYGAVVAKDRLVFVRGVEETFSLWTVPFDPAKGEVHGEPALLSDRGLSASASRDGTLVYRRELGRARSEPVWVDLQGQVEPFGRPLDTEFVLPATSFDGRQVFLSTPATKDPILAYDIDRGVLTTALIPDGEGSAVLGTLADGRLVVASLPDNETTVRVRGSRAEPEVLTEGIVFDIDAKGERVLVGEVGRGQGSPLEVLDLSSGERTQLGTQLVSIGRPCLSVDGRFAVYASLEAGSSQVYVLDLESGGPREQVTTEGGQAGWFDAAGSAILCVRGGAQLGQPVEVWRVSFEAEPTLRLGVPERLFAFEDADLTLMDFHPGEGRFIGFRRIAAEDQQIVLDTTLR